MPLTFMGFVWVVLGVLGVLLAIRIIGNVFYLITENRAPVNSRYAYSYP